MNKPNLKALLLSAAVLAGTASNTFADLDTSYIFNGNGNWSIDAVGGNATPVGLLQASIPVGATVEKAFLYSSLYSLGGPITTPAVNFEGTTYIGASWTSLGSYQPNPGTTPNFWLGGFRADVTSQVSSLAGGGSASLFNWTVNSEVPNSNIDGEVLAIVYSLPGEQTRTIAFLDGFSTSSGDLTTVTFANPLTAGQLADPNFKAELSLGIGFSAGDQASPTQASTVDVNGIRLTSSAGGADDGAVANGALITAGGIGDNPSNPANPNSNTSPDDELYTLNSFLSAGATSLEIRTQNPSLDDNIFFAGVNVTASAVVTPDPGNRVPEVASTLWLLCGALPGLLIYQRRSQRR